MSTHEQEQQIEAYIAHEDVLLRDWYIAYKRYETSIPGSEVTFIGVDRIQKIFDVWLTENREIISDFICQQWQYKKKRDSPLFSEEIALIIALTNFISTLSCGLALASPLTVATILVLKGLDKICNE